jgi:hypothetical protein
VTSPWDDVGDRVWVRRYAVLGLDEAIRRSPFPSDATGEALERARVEVN